VRKILKRRCEIEGYYAIGRGRERYGARQRYSKWRLRGSENKGKRERENGRKRERPEREREKRDATIEVEREKAK
jgi:hypothetical protein